jgi:hypothetical protein
LGKTRIREGVAAERRVSIAGPDMRHGRKSKSKLFNGYERHVAVDPDTNLILAGVAVPGQLSPKAKPPPRSRPISIGFPERESTQ